MDFEIYLDALEYPKKPLKIPKIHALKWSQSQAFQRPKAQRSTWIKTSHMPKPIVPNLETQNHNSQKPKISSSYRLQNPIFKFHRPKSTNHGLKANN